MSKYLVFKDHKVLQLSNEVEKISSKCTEQDLTEVFYESTVEIPKEREGKIQNGDPCDAVALRYKSLY